MKRYLELIGQKPAWPPGWEESSQKTYDTATFKKAFDIWRTGGDPWEIVPPDERDWGLYGTTEKTPEPCKAKDHYDKRATKPLGPDHHGAIANQTNLVDKNVDSFAVTFFGGYDTHKSQSIKAGTDCAAANGDLISLEGDSDTVESTKERDHFEAFDRPVPIWSPSDCPDAPRAKPEHLPKIEEQSESDANPEELVKRGSVSDTDWELIDKDEIKNSELYHRRGN